MLYPSSVSMEVSMAEQLEGVASAGSGLHEDWSIVESLLPEGWMEKARELGALRRTRGFANARTLLQVMLIHLAEGCGLRETAARASLAGLAHVSDVALLKRLRSCAAWFEWLAQRLREAPELRDPVPDGSAHRLLGERRLRVVDGSMVSEPGPTGSQWRLHYAIGLPELHCQEVHVGSKDEGETLKRFEVCAGDVFMADRGYAHPGGIAHVVRHHADVIVRMNLVTLPLYDPNVAERWDILAHVSTLKIGHSGSWPVSVRPKREPGEKVRGEVIAGRLCALRKSEAAAEQGRVRVRRESQRNGTAVQPQTLEAAGYVLIFTTLPAEISAERVLAVYRLRWQIELEFKRLKSLIQLGHLKKHDAQGARSWLQGKLLVALLVSRLIAHAERVSPWGYDISRIDFGTRSVSVA